jgi:hypothetical protein
MIQVLKKLKLKKKKKQLVRQPEHSCFLFPKINYLLNIFFFKINGKKIDKIYQKYKKKNTIKTTAHQTPDSHFFDEQNTAPCIISHSFYRKNK